MMGALGVSPALSQPEQVEDSFDSSYPHVSSIAEWDQRGSQELCFDVPTAFDFFEDDDLPFGVDSFHYRLRQVDTDGTTQLPNAVTISRSIVDRVEIRETYPNPTTGRASVDLTNPTGAEETRLEIFDTLGRSVRTVATNLESGRTTQTVDVSGLSSGVYFLRLYTEGETSTQKFTVVR